MSTELKSLLNFTLSSSTGPRAVELHIPTTLRVSGLFHEEDVVRDAHRLSMWLPNLALVFVASVDGKPLRFDQVETMLADVDFARGLLVRIRTLIDTLRERGKIYVLCPGCRRWETEVPITAYALGIAAPVPSAFEGPFLATPTLGSTTLNAAERPPLPTAAQVRFELPNAHLGLSAPFRGGILEEVQPQPEELQLEPDFVFDDEDDFDEDNPAYVPNRSGPGWRALLRLSRAIQPPVSLETLEQLPAVDFFFLELMHYLVFVAPVRPDTVGLIRCDFCGARFLPISSRG
jgi:hypothetical protein